jgi:hypothetical protein
MPSRVFYISKGPGRVSQTIQLKQSGKCRYCGKDFSSDEQIVSNGKKKKYYHRECAETLNILIPLPEGLANKKSKGAFNLQATRNNLLLDLGNRKQVNLV